MTRLGKTTRGVTLSLSLAFVPALLSCGGQSVSELDAAPENPDPSSSLDPNQICTRSEMRIEAKLDHEQLALAYGHGGQAMYEERCLSIFFGDYAGFLLLQGAGPFNEGGSVSAASAWLMTPPVPGTAPRWLCSADSTATLSIPGESVPNSNRVTLHAQEVKDLGPCPGEPVPGTITFKLNDASAPVSTVSGIPLAEPLSLVTLGRPAQAAAGQFGDCSAIYARWDDTPSGYLVTSQSGPDPEAVYCFGNVRDTGDGLIEISEVSRLGACAEAAATGGELAACYD